MRNPLIHFIDEASICKHFELTKTEFKQAMTHNSSPNKHNGSRYAFLGQYGFKGLLAQWISTNVGGTGTDLQHFLGNIASQKRMEELYDNWSLKRFIIYGEKCNPNLQKHIFAFSFIGCLMTHTPPHKLELFMLDFFIHPNDYLLPKTHLLKDDWQKLVFLCKQNGYAKPELTYSLTEQEKHRFEIVLSDGKHLQCESISYRYARKKIIHKALEYIVVQEEEKLKENPTHQALEELLSTRKISKKEAEKAARQQVWEEKLEIKRSEKEKRKALKKQAAIEQDKERRKNKEETKKKKESRKGQNTIYRDYSAEEIAAMNSAKRRRLEDLGILAKRN